MHRNPTDDEIFHLIDRAILSATSRASLLANAQVEASALDPALWLSLDQKDGLESLSEHLQWADASIAAEVSLRSSDLATCVVIAPASDTKPIKKSTTDPSLSVTLDAVRVQLFNI